MRPLKNGSSIPTLRSSIAPKPVIEITSNKITYFWRLDKAYLEQEYIKNGKSMAQIAREKGCARSTVGSVIHALNLSTEDRPTGRLNSKGQLAYGERLVRGQIVPHRGELKILHKIKSRRNEGASFGQIANWLNSEGIPTKNRVKMWDRPTIFKILKREGEKTM